MHPETARQFGGRLVTLQNLQRDLQFELMPILCSVPGIGPVASHNNLILKTFADRLRARGKPHKVVITAVARNLITIANAPSKSRLKWTIQAA